MQRRSFLAMGTVALGVGLAGCSSSCPDTDAPKPAATSRLDTVEAGVATSPLSTQRHDWPQYRYGAGHTGFGAGNTVPAGTPRLAWKRVFETTGATNSVSPPVLADGVVYVGIDDGGIVALEATTGAVHWTTEQVGSAVAPAVADGSVYVHDTDELVSLASDDGSVRWRDPLPLPSGAPTVHRDTVVASSRRGVVAFDAETGTRRWEAEASSDEGPPAVFGSSVFVSGASLTTYDLGSGDEQSTESVGRGLSAPVVDETGIYVESSDRLYALSHDDDQNWTYARESNGFDTPVVTDELVYAVEMPPEGPRAVFAVDRTSGEPTPRWCSWLGEGTAHAASDDAVLVATDNDRSLQQFSSRFGEAGWELRAERRLHAPAIGTDAVFVTTDGGAVAALTEVTGTTETDGDTEADDG